jgi:hypothetical protein
LQTQNCCIVTKLKIKELMNIFREPRSRSHLKTFKSGKTKCIKGNYSHGAISIQILSNLKVWNNKKYLMSGSETQNQCARDRS